MKITTILSITTLIFAACSATKKSQTSATPTSSSTPAPVSTNTFLVMPSATGIYAPGDAELAAVQPEYKDATLEQLKAGYILYTEGACIKCHKAKNIYSRGIENWKLTIEQMAPMAKITDIEKDALYKYVMAIKAMQPK